MVLGGLLLSHHVWSSEPVLVPIVFLQGRSVCKGTFLSQCGCTIAHLLCKERGKKGVNPVAPFPGVWGEPGAAPRHVSVPCGACAWKNRVSAWPGAGLELVDAFSNPRSPSTAQGCARHNQTGGVPAPENKRPLLEVVGRRGDGCGCARFCKGRKCTSALAGVTESRQHSALLGSNLASWCRILQGFSLKPRCTKRGAWCRACCPLGPRSHLLLPSPSGEAMLTCRGKHTGSVLGRTAQRNQCSVALSPRS